MTTQGDRVRSSFAKRARQYDHGDLGRWHMEIADDFIQYLQPINQRSYCLDLACGTGLVTVKLAEAVGPKGFVVGVDLTREMIDVARQTVNVKNDNSHSSYLAPIEWVVADCGSDALLEVDAIREVLAIHGGFDVVSVCSALVLFPDPETVLRLWIKNLLKPGGRLIVDTTTEIRNVQYMMSYYLPKALGMDDIAELSAQRTWVKSSATLPDACKKAGLEILKSLRREHGDPKTSKAGESTGTNIFEADESTGMKVFEAEMTGGKYEYLQERSKLEDARQIWPKIWKEAAIELAHGKRVVMDVYWLYVVVGRKPES